MLVISPKMPILGQMSNLVPFWTKITQFDISGSTRRIFLKVCSIAWYYKKAKVICLKFSIKYLLDSNGQFLSLNLCSAPKHFDRAIRMAFFKKSAYWGK